MTNYVLIVDDDMDVRHLVSDVVDAMELEYKQAENGQLGLDMIKAEGKPSLIILDLMMPIMDGFTMIAKLHANTNTRHIPVILLSAIADNETHMRKLSPSVIGVLRKGQFSLRDLSELISSTLGIDGMSL